MKKHPVDDLFKRKLSELEKKPSENAWLRIQAKNKPRRQPVGWIWYAAASLAVGLFGGYLIWQNSDADLAAPLENRVMAKVESKQPEKSINAEESPKGTVAISGNNVPEEPILAGNAAKQETKSRKPVKDEVKSFGEQERISVEIIERPVAVVSQNALAEAKLPEVAEQKSPETEQPVDKVLKQNAEPARTIIVAVESDLNESEDKPKTSKFSRVFRQLKNARAGERVDWEEVGFNPKTLVARMDDRLRGKDDKGSENENPKDRTKL